MRVKVGSRAWGGEGRGRRAGAEPGREQEWDLLKPFICSCLSEDMITKYKA